MTFNTRCPACTTVFAVPPSAISASGGWVRCGRCSEVFDAAAHRDGELNSAFDEVADRLSRQMQIPMDPLEMSQQGLRPRRDGESTGRSQREAIKSDPVSRASPMVPARSEESVSSPSVVRNSKIDDTANLPEAPQPTDAEPAANDKHIAPKKSSVERRRRSSSRNQSVSQWPEPLPVERGTAREPANDDIGPSQERIETRRMRQARSRNKTEALVAAPEVSDQQAALPLEVESPAIESREPEHSVFAPVYQEKTSVFSPSSAPSVATWVWSAVVVGLFALMLAGQILWTQRNELATHYPGLRPILVSMCQQLQCKIKPLRQLDMVALDNSVFRLVTPSDKGDLYQLTWVVTNQALEPVAAPALELTLNDVLDRPLLRKVILPADVTGDPELAIAAEGKWQGSLNLTVLPPEGGVKVSGYRLLAFYP